MCGFDHQARYKTLLLWYALHYNPGYKIMVDKTKPICSIAGTIVRNCSK
jgi:hypothetical protein